jgi:hypothetical protein
MINPETLNNNLNEVNTKVYQKCSLKLSGCTHELEGDPYDACQFKLNGKKIISRSAKITPKKIGQFVTFWKRNAEGITEPYAETDSFDFYAINVKDENRFGQFVFPKAELIRRGILSTERKDGKRGFRVYPIWDIAQNKQAVTTQKWQLNYFYEISETTDFEKVKALYQSK